MYNHQIKPIEILTRQKWNLLTLILTFVLGGFHHSCQGQAIPSTDSISKLQVPTQADSLMVFLSRRAIQTQRDVPCTFKGVHVLTRGRKKWRLKRNQRVRIFEGRIDKIRSAWLPMSAKKGRVLQGQGIKGHYLAPGLIDMHVHLHCDLSARLSMLRYGVTVVRDFSTAGDESKERELINKRCLVSPLLFSARSGQFWAAKEGLDPQPWGSDFLFVKHEYCFISRVDPELVDSLGLAVAWQGTQEDAWLQVGLLDGTRTIEGLDYFLPEDWAQEDRPAENRNLETPMDGIWIVPSLVSTLGPFSPSKYYETFYKGGYQFLPTSGLDNWRAFVMPNLIGGDMVKRMDIEYLSRYHESRMSITRALIQKGASILVGTDAGTNIPFVVPGFSFHEEMEMLHNAGLSTTQVLDAATLEAAKALRAENDLGQIKKGMLANMVLLKKNPIKDLDHYLSIEGVMVQGFWLGEQEMQWIKQCLHEVEPIKGRSLK